jgi:hypothetical protein
MVRSGKGGSLKERYEYLTMFQGKSKKKTIVSVGRRMAELMYSVLRNKAKYEVRHWKGPLNNPVAFAEQARSA